MFDAHSGPKQPENFGEIYDERKLEHILRRFVD